MNELITVMAAVYITYVIVESHLPPVAYARDYILDRVADGGSIMYLLTCWWCTGFWVTLLTVLGAWLVGVQLDVPVLLVPMGALISGLTGMIYGILDLTHANLVKGLNRE